MATPKPRLFGAAAALIRSSASQRGVCSRVSPGVLGVWRPYGGTAAQHNKPQNANMWWTKDKQHSQNQNIQPEHRSASLEFMNDPHLSEEGPEQVEINKRIVRLGKQRKWLELLRLYQNTPEKFSFINYSTLLSQLGRNRNVEIEHPVFLQVLENLDRKITESHDGLQQIGVRGMADVVHAIGAMGLKDNENARNIMEFANRPENAAKIARGPAQSIAAACWGFGKFGDSSLEHSNLFKEVTSNAEHILQEGTTVGIASTLWAFGRLEFKEDNFLSEVDHHSERLFQYGDVQSISTIAWAFAKLKFHAPKFFTLIEENADHLVTQASPQEITKLAVSASKLGIRALKVFAAIDEKVPLKMVHQGQPHQISTTLRSFGALRIKAPNLCAEIEKNAQMIVDNSPVLSLSAIASAFSTFNYRADQFFDSLCKRIDSEDDNWDMWSVCKITLAMTILNLNIKHEETFRNLWGILIDIESGEYGEMLFLVVQVFGLSHLQGIHIPPIKLSAQDIEKLTTPRPADAETDSQRSAVAEALRKLGFGFEENVVPWNEEQLPFPRLPSTVFSLHFADVERKTAIRCYRERAFLVSIDGIANKELNGLDSAKARFYEQLGWKVVGLPLSEWADKEEHERDDHLRQVLKELG